MGSPSLIAREISRLSLEELKLHKFVGAVSIRLEKIESLDVLNCPGLSNRIAEQIESLEE